MWCYRAGNHADGVMSFSVSGESLLGIFRGYAALYTYIAGIFLIKNPNFAVQGCSITAKSERFDSVTVM